MPGRHQFEPVEHALEMDESLRMQAAEGPARAIAGLAIFALVILSATGLLGDGRLSKESVSDGRTHLDYERVTRLGKETQLAFELPAGSNEIGIPLDYFRKFKLDKINPDLAASRIVNGYVVYRFPSQAPSRLQFYFESNEVGAISEVLRVNGEPFPVNTLILP